MQRRDEGMEPSRPFQGMSDTFAVMDFVADCYRAPLMALAVRSGTIGRGFQGLTMFVGVAAMFLTIELFGGPSGPVHAIFACGFLALVLAAHTAKRPILWRWGYECSTHYDGQPSQTGDELTAKQWTIPGLGILIGVLMFQVSQGTAVWFLAASVCQSATTASYRHRLRRQVQGMRDARIQQQVLRDAYEGEQR